jgi:glycosyltransferase involved in cell wall biosynthesis
MKAIRLLAISPACHQPVNRAIYRELALQHGIHLHLVVPQRLFVGSQWRETPRLEETLPYELSMLDITGTHGRLQRMRGLADLARRWNPTHVLVDNDPATLMTRQATRACPQAVVWALTAENLAPSYLRDFISGVKSGSPSCMVGPVLIWLMRRLVHPTVDRVFVLSSDGTRVMEEMGCKATQIPLGFDSALFRIQTPSKIAATRVRLGLQQRTVGYFGRLTPEKGLHLLIEALAQLQDLPWSFLLDHFSDYQTKYTCDLQEKIERLGLQSRVVYFDAKHDEMPDYMNAVDIVVLPSVSTPKWKEQYGRVLPEAMACGKVVVGSDSGAIPELVGKYGHIFPEGNVTALAAVLRDLLTRSDLKAAGETASAYAHEQLSIKRQAEIWAGLLKA